jgi:hypothetical protein
VGGDDEEEEEDVDGEEDETLGGVATAARATDPAALMRTLASAVQRATAGILTGDSVDTRGDSGDTTGDTPGDTAGGSGGNGGGVDEDAVVDIAAVVRECIALEHEAHAASAADAAAVRAAAASLRAQTEEALGRVVCSFA